MYKKQIGIGSISLLLVIVALIWSYNIFGFCLGDNILNSLNLPTWSNTSNEQIVNTISIVTFTHKGSIHYTAYYSLILVLPALVLAMKNKNHLFTTVGKWIAVVFIVSKPTVGNDLVCPYYNKKGDICSDFWQIQIWKELLNMF